MIIALNIRSPEMRRRAILYSDFALSTIVGGELGPLTMICAGVVVMISITTKKTIAQRTSETIANTRRWPHDGGEKPEFTESFCPDEGAKLLSSWGTPSDLLTSAFTSSESICCHDIVFSFRPMHFSVLCWLLLLRYLFCSEETLSKVVTMKPRGTVS